MPPRGDRSTPYTAVGTRRGYLSVAVPVVLGNTFLAARYPGESSVLTVVLAAVLALLVLATAVRFAHHPPTPVTALGLGLAVAGLTAAGLANVTAGGVVDYRGWVVGFAADLTMFLAFHLGPRHLVLPVAAQTLVIARFAYADPTVAVADAFGALITPLSLAGVACVVGSLLRRSTRQIQQGEALLDAHLEEQAWQESAAEARRVHLADLRREVTPFLTEAAATQPSADLRDRARLLAARCRDQLHLAAPLPPQVQEVVDEARRRGCTVSFRVGDEPVAWPAELLTALEAVLTAARPDVVTLVPAPEPRLTCLPPLPVRLRHDLAAYDVVTDAVRSVIRLSSDRTSSPPHSSGPIPVG